MDANLDDQDFPPRPSGASSTRDKDRAKAEKVLFFIFKKIITHVSFTMASLHRYYDITCDVINLFNHPSTMTFYDVIISTMARYYDVTNSATMTSLIPLL